jgi:hypothetical protein
MSYREWNFSGATSVSFKPSGEIMGSANSYNRNFEGFLLILPAFSGVNAVGEIKDGAGALFLEIMLIA